MKTKRTIPRVLGLVTFVIAASFGHLYYQNSQVPELGLSEGRFKPLSDRPNNVSSQATDPNKTVEPLPFKESPEATMAAIKEAVERCGGAAVKKETPDYLYVVFSSPTMGFRDDSEFWLDTENRVVHFRSAARAGYSDMGKNRERYDLISSYYSAL